MAKALLQSLFSILKIDTKCLQRYRPMKKKDKNSRKNKSTDFPSSDLPNEKQYTYQSQTNKNDLDHQKGF